MKILIVSDEECPAFWDYYQPGRLQDYDLIISCGDLKAKYLSFLVTMARCPLLYVHGNHDTHYVKEHPEFSWQGAKGIVAITGYAGAFGYRITDLHLFDEQTQQWMLDKTTEVAQALRASGWQIACHILWHCCC